LESERAVAVACDMPPRQEIKGKRKEEKKKQEEKIKKIIYI